MPRGITTKRSLRFVLTAWYTATLSGLALALAVFLYHRLDRDLTKQYDRFLRTYAADLGANLLEYPENLAEALEQELLYYRPQVVEFRAFDENRRLLFASAGWGDSSYPILESTDPATFHTIALPGQAEPCRYVKDTVESPQGQPWVTETAISLRYVNKTLVNYLRNMMLFILPIVAFGAIGGFLLAKRALRPAVELAATAREISSQNLSRRLPRLETGDELARLAADLNEMLDRLEEFFNRIERFSTDLAHELRTPITILKGETENALLNDAGSGDLRELLVRHSEIYESMTRMISDLLDLLRSGSSQARGHYVEAQIHRIVSDTVDSFRVLTEEKGVSLELAPVGVKDLHIWCEPSAIGRLVANLLDNAIRHTPSGGSVRITIVEHGGSVHLTVEDSGEGIPQHEIDRVFERFFRGEKQRASGRTSFGLGLSICRQIATDHDGTLEITSEVGRGTTVRLELPVKDVVPRATMTRA